MRALSWLVLPAVLLAGCLDFSTEGKSFRCEGGVGRCGPDAGAGGGGPQPWDGGALRLVLPDGGAPGELGRAVAMSRDALTLALGSPSGAGAVWVFASDGEHFTLQAELRASNAGAGDGFGAALALSADGTTLAVGSPGEDGSGTGRDPPSSEGKSESGAVYVFDRLMTGWAQVAYLKGFDSDPGDRVGTAVAISDDGNLLAAGAPGESGVPGDSTSNAVASSGAVWLVRRPSRTASWSTFVYVKADDAATRDAFGSSVALASDGVTAAAGAPGRADAGAAYVFLKTSAATWTQQALLTATPAQPGSALGGALALSSSGAAVAAGASGASAVFTATRSFNAWSVLERVELTGPSRDFGGSVALSSAGDVLLAGHREPPDGGPGEAWVFGDGPPRVLGAPGAVGRDGFGAAVAMSGDATLLVIGAPEQPDGGGAWVLRR